MKENNAPYLDPSVPLRDRVEDLLFRMTDRELVGQLVQYAGPGVSFLRGTGKAAGDEVDLGDNVPHYRDLNPRTFIAAIENGEIGSFLSVYDEGEADALQSIAARSRLGIPLLIGVDAIHGHGMYRPGATVFPTPLGLAATFDPDQAEIVARITAREMRATGAHWTFSPNVDVVLDPRWGRTGETFGEDPYLVGEFGRAMVRGYAGDGGEESVLSCAKHFVGGGDPDNGINFAPLDASERTLEETFYPPYRAVIEEGCPTVMAAHNDVNGIPCHAHPGLLTDLLKGTWKFEGFVVSDWTDIFRLHTVHRIAESIPAACVQSVLAGMDMHMHGPGFFEPVLAAVETGVIPRERLTDAVRRILLQKFRLGLFDRDDAGSRLEADRRGGVGCAAHRDAALEAAAASIVLLKNEGNLLPVSRDVGTVLVAGPNAANLSILGDWSVPQEDAVSLLDAVRAKLGDERVISVPTNGVRSITDEQIDETVRIAKTVDVAILAIGDCSLRFDRDNRSCGENADRARLDLIGRQLELVRAVHATGVRVVVVLINGRPIAEPWIAEHIPAIIEAWEGGSQGGRAIAEVLFGDRNPGGRLPVTVPRSVGHIRQHYRVKPASHYRTYVDDPAAPLYEFGYGLSYTRFQYADLRVAPILGPDEDLRVVFRLTNVGDRDGEEVALLFVSDVIAEVTLPEKTLAGFKRLTLKAGQTREVEMTIARDRLAYLDRALRRRVEPGEFRLSIGVPEVLAANFRVS